MAAEYDWLLDAHGPLGDAQALFELAQRLEAEGKVRLAASAYDRAFGLRPDSEPIAKARLALLERLSVAEYGINFRYIPAGSFLMGSDVGEADEAPVHPVRLDAYWLSDTPISWAAYCDIMDWSAPPRGFPKQKKEVAERSGLRPGFFLNEENKIRQQYCKDATSRATHQPGTSRGARDDPRRPWRYDRKPMVSVSWLEAADLCAKMASEHVRYRLPTEAEWEKAARGGLIGCAYPWGDLRPADDRCDFDRFDQFSILPMRRFQPNNYRLYAMCGCVWEWTSDWYDANYYAESSTIDPTGPLDGAEKVLRGGSWADCAGVVTVTFRASRRAEHWRAGKWGGHFTPNIGFRLCRVEQRSGE